MKKILVLIIGVLALVSCRDEVSQVSGAYSYTISGVATVDGDETALSDERGAMELVRIHADSALVTFTALRGNAYTTKAFIDKKQIVLSPYTRTIHVGINDYTVSASGIGTIYDGTIVINLSYQSADVQADALTLLCKKNK